MGASSPPRTETQPSLARRFARHPLAHFVVAGSLLFAVERMRRPAVDARETVLVSAEDIERARSEWIARRGAIGPADEQRILERAASEEILEREASKLALDRGDRLVRDRLVKLGRFLDVGGESDDDVEGSARALHLERQDPVIRRYLAHLVELALTGVAQPPDEEAVRRRYEALVIARPPADRYRFAQVYLAGDRHGAALEADATDLLARLQAQRIGPEEATRFGDPFPTGAEVGPVPASEISRRFGSGFAAAVAEAPDGRWYGPLRSSYGLHLVWLRQRSAGRAPTLDEVRNQLAWDLAHERQDQRRREGLERLRSRYRIEVAG